MKRILLTSTIVTLLAVGFASQAMAIGQQSFRMRIGIFQPEGDSTYWQDTNDVFFGDIGEFDDTAIGIDYVVGLNHHLSFIVSTDYYRAEVEQAYRDFEGPFGGDIVHDTYLDVTPVTAGILLSLAPPRAPIRFFVGAGGGFYLWQLEEVGDFIDFDFDPPEIYFDSFVDDGAEFGYYLQAGLEVPFNRQVSFVADARWERVEAELGGDFEGLGELDLSGTRYTAGIGWFF